jgi:3',5'-nucleoside bisphosphate phosphatase
MRQVNFTSRALLSALLYCVVLSTVKAQVRADPGIPDIPGYRTIKGDFHMHTVFSDGKVWPTTRVEEAWREGLDVIAITDHIEYRPFIKEGDHNIAYDIAKSTADRLGIMLIKGSEITRREMPPGHLNAIFLEDANALEKDDWRDALRAARDQGAFIFWNHPGWSRQQKDTTLWWDEHTWMMENNLMHGIEVVSGLDHAYYPEAHTWAKEKGLTMMGTTDIHNPIGMDYNFALGEKRAMTLIFAKEFTENGLKEALFAGRTIAYYQDNFYGNQEYLEALFKASLQIQEVRKSGNRFSVKVYNPTSIPIKILKAPGNEDKDFFRWLTLSPRATDGFTIVAPEGSNDDFVEVKWIIENYKSGPGESIAVTMRFDAKQ